MNIHDQVCSMEYAKRLKELGVKQISYFYWSKLVENSDYELRDENRVYDLDVFDKISAFTVAELGMILGKYSDTGIGEDQWVCRYFEPHSDITHHAIANTEADARAKMLVYLLEKGLIKND